jgi:MFS transporter, OFA family, oxalate/formate antiporter
MINNFQRWTSLIACLTAGLCAGFGYAWSVFLKPMAGLFNLTASELSLSFTLIMSTAAASAIFAGKALEYIKPPRLLLAGGVLFGTGIVCIGFVQSLVQLYLFAVIAGIGLGTVYPGATMSNIIRYFPDRRGMASGLLTAGYGIGAVVWAPFAVYLIESNGPLFALRILGILFFIIIALMSLIVRTAPDNFVPRGWKPASSITNQVSGSLDKDWKQMMSTLSFYVLAVLFVLGTISGMMVVGHASPIVQNILKVNPVQAGKIVGYLAAGIVLGKIFWGILSDKLGRNTVFIALFAITGTAMFIMSKINSYSAFVAAMSVTGFCYGGFLSLIGPVTADTFGQKHLGINFGIMFLTIALAAYLGPMLASAVISKNGGDYIPAFIIGIFINSAGMIIAICYVFIRNSKKYLKKPV